MEHNTKKELKTKLKTKNQMKKVILILALTISSFNIYSQNVQVDKDGNYISIKNSRKGKSVATDKFFVDNDVNKYPVYKSKNNKVFIIKTSRKTGKSYNYYLNI